MNDLRICVVCSKVFRTDLTTCPDDGTPLAVELEQRRTLVGSVLGSYRLVRALGEGGAGAVYEGEHVRLGRRMAIKLLHSDVTNEEMVTRFFNEARAVNEIRHPNIIDIEDFVSAPTGEHYMVMELLQGEDLRSVLMREGKLSPDRVTAIGAGIASALAAVHRVGIIHRDLKPENIFLSRDESGEESCKLLDFGVAKFTNDAQGVTRIGMTIGTPAYMAPEQIVTGGVVGPCSDIYALGIVLYEALTGKPAFVSPAIGHVLRAHCSEPVTPPSQRCDQRVPAALEAAILKCLEKKASDRFVDCEALCEALQSDRPVVRASTLPPASGRKVRMLLEVPAAFAATAVLVMQIMSQVRPVAAAARSDSNPPVVAPVLAARTPQPAPAPALAPPASPAVEPDITVVLRSQPEHAQLFLGDKREPLGEAPVTITLPRSNDLVSLVARFPDKTETVQRIVPDHAMPPITFLKPAAPHPVVMHVAKRARTAQPGQKPRAGGGEKVGRDETVDPFTFK